MGSDGELEYHLLPVLDLNLLEKTIYTNLDTDVAEISKMPASLLKKLKTDR